MAVSINSKTRHSRPLTYPPGACIFCPAPTGVASPVVPPAAFWARFALYSARRLFNSAMSSNFGLFPVPPEPCPGGGFPVAARRSASACWYWVITRWLWAWRISSGTPSIPKISMSRLALLGSALSTAVSCSLCTWLIWTDSPGRATQSVKCPFTARTKTTWNKLTCASTHLRPCSVSSHIFHI